MKAYFEVGMASVSLVLAKLKVTLKTAHTETTPNLQMVGLQESTCTLSLWNHTASFPRRLSGQPVKLYATS